MIIQISSWDGTKTITIKKFFSYESVRKLNDIGTLKISLDIDTPNIDKFRLKKGYLIKAFLDKDIGDIACIFSGFLYEIDVSNNKIDIFAYDIVGYMKYRMIRGAKSYSGVKTNDIISDVFNTLNSVYSLPFTIGVNDISDELTLDFEAYTNFYDILSEIKDNVKDIQFRVIQNTEGNDITNILEISKDFGKTLDGVWSSNVYAKQRASAIGNWSWKDSLDKFCNYLVDKNGNESQDDESINESGLFEKHEGDEETLKLNVSFAGLPSLDLDIPTSEIAKINIGDKKAISCITQLEWFAFEYVGIIQEILISSTSSGSLNYKIKIGEELVEESNILDRTLKTISNFIKKVTR